MGKTLQRGFTLIEVMVALAIIAIMAAMGGPRLRQWMLDNQVREAAMLTADALHLARTEAMRSGINQIVFLGVDFASTPITNASGIPSIRVQSDIDNDCTTPDADDVSQRDFAIPDGVFMGTTNASTQAPADTGTASLPSTFTQPSSGSPQAFWVMFRPDGVPVGLTTACVAGRIGTGGGAVYITNGRVDYSISLTRLGAVRVSPFEQGSGTWN